MDYLVIGIVVAVVIVIIAVWAISTTNKFKRLEVQVQNGLSAIDTAMAKRYDTLKKMLDVTKEYMKHENDILPTLVQMRNGFGSINDMNSLNNNMDKVERDIFAVAENYPDLRSSEVFQQLQSSIREVENDLQAARRTYNGNVSKYNQTIKVFPNCILAIGRQPERFFEASEEQRQDVEMKFN